MAASIHCIGDVAAVAMMIALSWGSHRGEKTMVVGMRRLVWSFRHHRLAVIVDDDVAENRAEAWPSSQNYRIRRFVSWDSRRRHC